MMTRILPVTCAPRCAVHGDEAVPVLGPDGEPVRVQVPGRFGERAVVLACPTCSAEEQQQCSQPERKERTP
jgi:hypothetical protein